ncbi:hypothetical protein SHIRM173S_01591 [Streptomyces hirsutus]
MMGPAHSLSGAAAWLGVGAATTAAGKPMPWPVLLVGALICAGAALAPDLDHKAATISRSFGPVSKRLCEIVDKLSYAVYKATRKPGDPRRSGGHRTLTHTWLWAVLIGGGASVLAITGGRWAVLAILFVHMVLAIEGLLWRATRGASSDVLVWLLAATKLAVDPRRHPGRAGQRCRLAVPRSLARSTCGWGCRSSWVRWCTTSGTP